jgi:hypothetical protein
MSEQDGNGEKRTLKRLLAISLSIIGALFAVICALIAMMWNSLATGQAKNADAICANSRDITVNRERIIQLEVINDLRSQGKLKEE